MQDIIKDLMNDEIADACKIRQQHIDNIEKSKKCVSEIDSWLAAHLIVNLPFGTQRCNYNGIDIKVVRKPDAPTVSLSTPQEAIHEAHIRVAATVPFITYKPHFFAAGYKSLSLAQKNDVSDVVILQPQSPTIEVDYA